MLKANVRTSGGLQRVQVLENSENMAEKYYTPGQAFEEVFVVTLIQLFT